MMRLKLQLEPTPDGHNPYTIEVWDETGTVWFLSLDVDLIEKGRDSDFVEKITSWIVETVNSTDERKKHGN